MKLRMTSVVLTLASLLALAGCSDAGGGDSDAGSGGSGGDEAGDGGSSTSGSRSSGAGGDGSGGDSAGGAPSTSSQGGTGGTTSSTPASSTADASSSVVSVAAATSTTGTGGPDEYAMQRQTCVDTINELRATEGLPALGRWGDGELCADEEATSDEQSSTPHGAFGSCGESGQNECLGHGPDGIAGCLGQMWAEKDLPECTGCHLCHAQQGGCADCVFNVCGHYVNMSALYFSEAACGFSDLGGWDVINFR